jgi:hypothetical protein
LPLLFAGPAAGLALVVLEPDDLRDWAYAASAAAAVIRAVAAKSKRIFGMRFMAVLL